MQSDRFVAAVLLCGVLLGAPAWAAPAPQPKDCQKAAAELAKLSADFERWKAVSRRDDKREIGLMESRITSHKTYLAKSGDMQDTYQCQQMSFAIFTDHSSVNFKLPDALALDKCLKVDARSHLENLSSKYEAAKTVNFGADDAVAYSAMGTRLVQAHKDLADEGLKLPRCEALVTQIDGDTKSLAALTRHAAQGAKKK